MESIVDPSFDRLFVGSMPLFRAKAGPQRDLDAPLRHALEIKRSRKKEKKPSAD
jgi:hypothetical protein